MSWFIKAQSVLRRDLTPSESLPVGTILPTAAAGAPTGFFVCDGSAVSRTTYAALYAAIGLYYGNGDGSTTFNIPDCRGMFLRGWNQGRSDGYADPDASSRTNINGGASGNNPGSVQAEAMPNHSHAYSLHSNNAGASGADAGLAGQTVNSFGTYNSSTANTAVGTGSESRPNNIYVQYIIKF